MILLMELVFALNGLVAVVSVAVTGAPLVVCRRMGRLRPFAGPLSDRVSASP